MGLGRCLAAGVVLHHVLQVHAVVRPAPALVAGGIKGATSCRDPHKQPFDAKSIWNTPLGVNAQLKDVGLGSFQTGQYHDDENFVVPQGTDAVDVINQGWWGPTPEPARELCPLANSSNNYCHCVQFGMKSGTRLRIPHNWTTGSQAGNNGATFMLNATHAVQMQPAYRCKPGSPVLAEWEQWRLSPPTGPRDRYTTSLWGAGTYGAHGGSGLSSLGGQIRRGELNETAPDIQHALSFELFAHMWYYCNPSQRAKGVGPTSNRSSCFRWPALTADSYAVTKGHELVYGGTNPDLQPGTLLAVPSRSATAISMKLKTVVAKRILKALSTFGAYVVDDAAGTYLGEYGKTNINYEQGVADEVMENYGLDLNASPHTQHGVLFNDLTLLFRGMQAVSNNGQSNVGGGGKPIVSPPPLLCPLSQVGLKTDDRMANNDADALELRIVGAGSSKENPAFGTEVMLNVSCESECPAWVRIDRADGIAHKPAFFKPAWGLCAYSFGGAPDNRPVPIVASGWSAERNGKVLTQNSSNVTVYYDVGFLRTEFGLAATDLGPGSVQVTLTPTNTSSVPAAIGFDRCKFDRFVLAKSGTASKPAEFKPSFFYHQESESGTIVLTFQQPGIYYYGATPSFEGRPGGSSAGGMYDGAPSTHPTAFILTGPDGDTGNQSLPDGFAGPVHRMKPLEIPRQFCIINPNVTVFPGGLLSIPLCRPDPNNEIPEQPEFASVLVPSWLAVLPQNNFTCPGCDNPGYWAHLNSSAVVDKPATGSYTRYTFRSAHKRWSVYNNIVPLYLTFDEAAHAGKRATLWVMIHDDPSDASNVPLSHWQRLDARTVVLPDLPLPKALVTSITWTHNDALLLDSGRDFTFLGTYRRLGFNTVPMVSLPSMFETKVSDGANQSLSPNAWRWAYPGTFPIDRISV